MLFKLMLVLSHLFIKRQSHYAMTLAGFLIASIGFFGMNQVFAKTPKVSALPSHMLQVDNQPRDFYWYVPSTPPSLKPVVVLLHGYRGNPKSIARLSGLLNIAKQNGFVVILPEGRDAIWNVHAVANQYDDQDLRFLDQSLVYIEQHVRIDKTRIYAMGMSNGDFLAIRLACERPDTFSAVGAVSAKMAEPLQNEHCQTDPAVPVTFINGTDDPVVLW